MVNVSKLPVVSKISTSSPVLNPHNWLVAGQFAWFETLSSADGSGIAEVIDVCEYVFGT